MQQSLSNEVHMYTEFFETQRRLVERALAAYLRTANKRFIQACLSDVVPHIAPV